MGIASLGRDFGDELEIELWTDSSAAKGVASRIGLGKIRHLDTALLWLQNYVEKGRIKIKKEKGIENVADLGTKDLDEATMLKCLVHDGSGYVIYYKKLSCGTFQIPPVEEGVSHFFHLARASCRNAAREREFPRTP